MEASFDDALDQTRSAQRLRTALSLEGGGSGLDFLHVYYLAASKGGPYRAAAQALRHTNHGVTGRVELKDLHNDRLLCQGTFLRS